jgi:hypothetical protein
MLREWGIAPRRRAAPPGPVRFGAPARGDIDPLMRYPGWSKRWAAAHGLDCREARWQQ